MPDAGNRAMEEFISQPLRPHAGTFRTGDMARGLPGLPAGFDWNGQPHLIETLLESWKASATEGGRAGGERYLRRHYYRLRMADKAVWTVYFIRQCPRSGSPRLRWFLQSIARD
jgi:hypothetical protein